MSATSKNNEIRKKNKADAEYKAKRNKITGGIVLAGLAFIISGLKLREALQTDEIATTPQIGNVEKSAPKVPELKLESETGGVQDFGGVPPTRIWGNALADAAMIILQDYSDKAVEAKRISEERKNSGDEVGAIKYAQIDDVYSELSSICGALQNAANTDYEIIFQKGKFEPVIIELKRSLNDLEQTLLKKPLIAKRADDNERNYAINVGELGLIINITDNGKNRKVNTTPVAKHPDIPTQQGMSR